MRIAMTTTAIAPLLDTLDFVVLGAIGLATVAWISRKALFDLIAGTKKSPPNLLSFDASHKSKPAPTASKKERNFVKKMKEQGIGARNTGRNVIFFYGSQTGTAEDYAARLAKEGSQRFGLSTMTADMEEYDITYLDQLPEDFLAFFIMATYGEGEPTDNAVDFWEMITQQEQPEFSKSSESEDPEKPLKNLRYVVFGLGNKTYEHYNLVGRTVDKRLSELGATRIAERGEGDDDGSLEEDFLGWKDDMWKAVAEVMGVDENSKNKGPRQPAFEVVEKDDANLDNIFLGELTERKQTNGTRPIYDAKNPYVAPITTRDIFFNSDRRCLHGEIDITGSGLTYQTGDHVAIWPINAESEVERLARILSLTDKLDKVIVVKSTDPASTKPHPFPVPTTYRTVLRSYLDISAPPSRQTMSSLAAYAPTDKTKEILTRLGDDKDEFRVVVADARRNLGELLEWVAQADSEATSFSTIPFDLIVESLSRLQARYYSISSSSKAHPNQIHVTAVILDYKPTSTPERTVYGVATNYLWSIHSQLNRIQDGSPRYNIEGPRGIYVSKDSDTPTIKLLVHVRHSNFKLPRNPALPIIMVGPGTGVAPFRGFLQERAIQKRDGRDVGKTLLFFGCRRSDQDFMYQDEWPTYFEKLAENGSRMTTAFSREQSTKVYVQHRIQEYREELWQMIQQGGYIYVCGDAKNMARDVNGEFVRMAHELGGMTEEKAATFVKDLRGRGRYQEDVWS
ncbi:hypothetical protein BC938DRAFT_482754 [Jimgerdemannia flammicorona]|uniref:NADPH--cytochrome P450 reductase n=1 Tax=Jimgerdemannia flammicorona TaxID=994334 RepID=A0A433R0C8_9FUNG|nr:hypothetical protein BC938DRAFT_482754 [Jimgerdemannia flammicorona]